MSPQNRNVFSKLSWKNWHLLSQDNSTKGCRNTEADSFQTSLRDIFVWAAWPNSSWQQSWRELFCGNDGRVVEKRWCLLQGSTGAPCAQLKCWFSIFWRCRENAGGQGAEEKKEGSRWNWSFVVKGIKGHCEVKGWFGWWPSWHFGNPRTSSSPSVSEMDETSSTMHHYLQRMMSIWCLPKFRSWVRKTSCH